MIYAVPAGAASPRCGGAALVTHVSKTQGATGHGSLTLRFHNVSSHACSLRGYPGFDALTASGEFLRHAKRTESGFAGGSSVGVRTVKIKPGHWASATVEWHNFDFATGKSCTMSAKVAATPANTGATVVRRRAVSVCHLEVHPTVSGRTGNA